MNSNVLVLVVLLGYTASSAFGFQCYVCNSQNHTDCGSPPSERHLKNCEELHYENNEKGESYKVCRLQVIQTVDKKAIFDRRCGWKKHNENRESCILTRKSVFEHFHLRGLPNPDDRVKRRFGLRFRAISHPVKTLSVARRRDFPPGSFGSGRNEPTCFRRSAFAFEFRSSASK